MILTNKFILPFQDYICSSWHHKIFINSFKFLIVMWWICTCMWQSISVIDKHDLFLSFVYVEMVILGNIKNKSLRNHMHFFFKKTTKLFENKKRKKSDIAKVTKYHINVCTLRKWKFVMYVKNMTIKKRQK